MNMVYKFLALITLVANLQGHGFGTGTYVRNSARWHRIEHIEPDIDHLNTVLSYDCSTKLYGYRNVKSVARGTTNCYVKIGLDEFWRNDIVCTPSQEFYLPEYDIWVGACFLQRGDQLLSERGQRKSIAYVGFIAEPCDIYLIEVYGYHTFFVGEHSVLVKNMILPCVTMGYAFPFGGGAGGGLLGTLLGGTLTGTIGCVVGGVAIGYLVKCCINGREKSYDFTFDTAPLGILFQDKSEIQTDGTIGIPVKWPESEEATVAPEEPKAPVKTAEDIINGAQPEQESYKTKQYNNPNGSFSAANNDFDDLGLINVEDKGDGVRIGILHDGRTVVVRPTSSKKGFPTLEFQPRENVSPKEKSIKIRYTGK